MKVNDILVCSWGYGQTNVDFYQIIKVTEKSVQIREIESKYTEGDGWRGKVIPVPNVFKSKPMRKKIHLYKEEEFLMIESYALAKLWKGEPVRYTSDY